jgi:hypothetical protein
LLKRRTAAAPGSNTSRFERPRAVRRSRSGATFFASVPAGDVCAVAHLGVGLHKRASIATGTTTLNWACTVAAAHASQATLYRRWSTKALLVVDAVSRAKDWFLAKRLGARVRARQGARDTRLVAVHGRDRAVIPDRILAGRPDGSSLDIGPRSRPGRPRYVGFQSARQPCDVVSAGRPEHRRVLLDRPPPLDPGAVVRPRSDLRPDDAHSRARRGSRRFRCWLSSAQHNAADRREHRAGRSFDDLGECRDRQGPRAGSAVWLRARTPGPGFSTGPGLQEQLQGQAITSGQAEAFLVAGAMTLVAGLIVLFGLNIKHEDLATEEQPEAVSVG